jgi:hypothetical protein
VRQVTEALRSGKVQDYHEAKYNNARFLGERYSSGLIRRENGWESRLLNEMAFNLPALATP